MSLSARIGRAFAGLGAVSSPSALVAPLTAAYVLAYLVADVLRPLRVPVIQAGLVAAAGATLLFGSVATRPWAWWSMAALMLAALASDWMLVDNHVFLATYWLVAMAAALSAPEAERSRALALAASSLIGLTMLFATLHKLRTPEYLSGDFFHLTFITESRFAPLGWVLGEDVGQLALDNADRLAALKSDPTQGPSALRGGSPGLRSFALSLSWLVVLFELVLAVLWLVRFDGRVGRLVRHGALLAFMVSTYAIAPVPGFGAILGILGLADTQRGEDRLRAAYLAALVYVLFAAAIVRVLLG